MDWSIFVAVAGAFFFNLGADLVRPVAETAGPAGPAERAALRSVVFGSLLLAVATARWLWLMAAMILH